MFLDGGLQTLCLPISDDDMVKTIDMMKSLYRQDGDSGEEVRLGKDRRHKKEECPLLRCYHKMIAR